ncbi:MAG: hypothetical protein B0D92_00730 [Spirochaeta sp. LUC14_002_19_P3]|nr:MAG: hypothetical protein B0D92_00730 [Spirochaeta sp. LUC14_002_19_P3]
MADEELELDNALESDDKDFIARAKKPRGIPERLVKVLAFIAIGIVAIVVSITVSVLTFRFMDRGNRTRQFPVLSEEYQTAIPAYSIWNFFVDDGYDLRTQTSDQERFTVSAKIKFGYDETKYKELVGELASKNDILMDAIRFYFSQRTRAQLVDEAAVKMELKNKVNSLLSQGEVEQILFLQYQIIGL